MTTTEALELVKQWPRDRTVPKRLRRGYDTAKGLQRVQIGMLTEALMAACESETDFALVAKYFG